MFIISKEVAPLCPQQAVLFMHLKAQMKVHFLNISVYTETNSGTWSSFKEEKEYLTSDTSGCWWLVVETI